MPNEDDIKAVSNRNHFISLEAFIEESAPFYRKHLQNGASLDDILYAVGRRLLHEFQWAAERGATAGIEQAVKLILDPKYRDSKRKQRKDWAERRKAEEEEKITRRLVESADPEAMAKKMEDRLAWLNARIEFHKKELEVFEVERRRHMGLWG